jgi:hypothetical protein
MKPQILTYLKNILILWNCKTFELMNTNNLSVHVPDDDIYYRNKKKKKLTKKTKVWNDFDHMNYLIFYCFQLETAS